MVPKARKRTKKPVCFSDGIWEICNTAWEQSDERFKEIIEAVFKKFDNKGNCTLIIVVPVHSVRAENSIHGKLRYLSEDKGVNTKVNRALSRFSFGEVLQRDWMINPESGEAMLKTEALEQGVELIEQGYAFLKAAGTEIDIPDFESLRKQIDFVRVSELIGPV